MPSLGDALSVMLPALFVMLGTYLLLRRRLSSHSVLLAQHEMAQAVIESMTTQLISGQAHIARLEDLIQQYEDSCVQEPSDEELVATYASLGVSISSAHNNKG